WWRVRRGVEAWVCRKKLRYRIYNRHLIVGVRGEVVLSVIELNALPVERAEIPLQHRRSEKAGRCGAAGMAPHSFIVQKKEELVFYDWSTECRPENVLRIRILRGNREGVIVRPSIRIQIFGLEQVIG